MFIQYFVFVLCTMACGLTATYLCEKYSIEAQGSGIPEIKTYLSGVRISSFMSPKSYIIKFIGLILIDGGGFCIGKGGPYIQMTTMICNFMCGHPYLQPYKE